MNLAILGSGTSAPRLERNMAGYLLEVDNKKILLDSGAGTIRQLLKLKVNLLNIDNIFYTHFHNDHINELPAIIWSNNYGTLREKALNLYGPKGFKKYFKILYKKILFSPKLNFKINIKEMKNNSIVNLKINKNTLKIKSKRTRHTENSIAYRIEYKDKSIVYTGDADYSKNIIDLAKNANLLLLECSLPDNKKAEGHLTPSLCGKIAAKANAKKLVLTHFYPEVLKTNIIKAVKKYYSGNIILARDFMKLKI